jgi:ATP phosphoribosyltransferase regulatory subunit
MIHPIPSGTRDVLPDEMRELRAITDALGETFASAGYGEVSTPALEYESTLARGDLAGTHPAYRLFDEQGAVLVLRSDMTVPIARLAATRYPSVDPPLRFCYLAHAYRAVQAGRGHPREFLQAGIELLGAPAPEGTAEAVSLLCAALDSTGLGGYRVGVGDASIYPALLGALRVPHGGRERLLREVVARNFVGLEREIEELGLDGEAAELLLQIPQVRGGAEVLDDLPAAPAAAVEGLRRVHQLLSPAAAERVIFDLGLSRGIGYYTGAVFDVYDPALGAPLGGGGRYDDLLGRFGRSLPAVGWALTVERVHEALNAEEAR